MTEPGDELIPVEELRLAREMHDLGVAIRRQNLRRRRFEADDVEIERLLQPWLGQRWGAEHGDAVGWLRR